MGRIRQNINFRIHHLAPSASFLLIWWLTQTANRSFRPPTFLHHKPGRCPPAFGERLHSHSLAPKFKMNSINLACSSEWRLPTLSSALNDRDLHLQAPSFLNKLRSILSLKCAEHIVSWLPEGKIWRIHKKDLFVATILPLLEEFSGWDSFLLTLRSSGFREVSNGFDSVAFYSEVRLHSMGNEGSC